VGISKIRFLDYLDNVLAAYHRFIYEVVPLHLIRRRLPELPAAHSGPLPGVAGVLIDE
jgi:hypothetical protein